MGLERISVDNYFLKMATVVAERATCRRHHVGAVAVRDKHVLATGYNGAPSGFKDCLELGCMRDELGITTGVKRELCRAVHAEENIVTQASLHSTRLLGSTVYCTHTPCVTCARLLVNCGVERFVSCGVYNNDCNDVFRQGGVVLDVLGWPSLIIETLE